LDELSETFHETFPIEKINAVLQDCSHGRTNFEDADDALKKIFEKTEEKDKEPITETYEKELKYIKIDGSKFAEFQKEIK